LQKKGEIFAKKSRNFRKKRRNFREKKAKFSRNKGEIFAKKAKFSQKKGKNFVVFQLQKHPKILLYVQNTKNAGFGTPRSVNCFSEKRI
jgi:hypothetical protein